MAQKTHTCISTEKPAGEGVPAFQRVLRWLFSGGKTSGHRVVALAEFPQLLPMKLEPLECKGDWVLAADAVDGHPKAIPSLFSSLHLTTESGKPDSCFLYLYSISRWGSMSPSFGQWDLRESLLRDSGKDHLVPFNRNGGGGRFLPWPPCPSQLWMRSWCLEPQ